MVLGEDKGKATFRHAGERAPGTALSRQSACLFFPYGNSFENSTPYIDNQQVKRPSPVFLPIP